MNMHDMQRITITYFHASRIPNLQTASPQTIANYLELLNSVLFMKMCNRPSMVSCAFPRPKGGYVNYRITLNLLTLSTANIIQLLILQLHYADAAYSLRSPSPICQR